MAQYGGERREPLMGREPTLGGGRNDWAGSGSFNGFKLSVVVCWKSSLLQMWK